MGYKQPGTLILGRQYSTLRMTTQTWDAQGKMNVCGKSQNKKQNNEQRSTALHTHFLMRLIDLVIH